MNASISWIPGYVALDQQGTFDRRAAPSDPGAYLARMTRETIESLETVGGLIDSGAILSASSATLETYEENRRVLLEELVSANDGTGRLLADCGNLDILTSSHILNARIMQEVSDADSNLSQTQRDFLNSAAEEAVDLVIQVQRRADCEFERTDQFRDEFGYSGLRFRLFGMD